MDRHKPELSSLSFNSVYFGTSIKTLCADNAPCIFSENEMGRNVIDILPYYDNRQLDDRIKKFIGYFNEKSLSKSNSFDFGDVLFEFADSLPKRFEDNFSFGYEFEYIRQKLAKETDEGTFVTAVGKSKLKKYPNEENEHLLEQIFKKAVIIRLFLYCITGDNYFAGQYEKAKEEITKILQYEIFYSNSNYSYLFPDNKIQDYILRFNICIDIDYAQNLLSCKNGLYYSLKMITEKSKGYEEVKKLLFSYLSMKQQFQTEILQSSERAGSCNFFEYSGGKNRFIFDTVRSEENIAVDSICSVCGDMKFRRIEMRISPKMKWQELAESVKMYDRSINRALKIVKSKRKLNCQKNFFYTLYFPKESSESKKSDCRYHGLRNKVGIRAKSIVELREYADYSIAGRVLGIDACSHGIDCRPEVFGSAFRYLQYYEPKHRKSGNKKLRQLKSTYHIAENNYDVINGLREIYEAVYFLALRSGSRLGNTALLSMSPVKYYSKHNNTVSMPGQVFLDNVMWLYYFINDNKIIFDDNISLFSYLDDRFKFHFNKIYVDDIQSCFVDNVLDEAKKSYLLDFPRDRITYTKENCEFDIHHYYLAYMLRGDDPELYKKGFLLKRCEYSEEYRICNTHTDMEKARRNFEANYLYYLYHFSDRIKDRGAEMVEEVLPDYVIRAICIVQKKMKRLVSELGIGIETNQTLNISINTDHNYAEYPISNLYDNSLPKNSKNIRMNFVDQYGQ